MTQSRSNGIRSIERALEVVETLNDLGGAGVSELSREVDLPKSTVHNHLVTLEEAEYVVNDEGVYRTGLKFLQLGERVRNQHALFEVARPEVDKLAAKTGEISGLMTEEHGAGVFLYRGRGEEAARIDTDVGDRTPLHCTALGKAILAHLPPERTEAIIDRQGLPPVTTKTITDRETLLEQLAEIRERKIAFDDEERLNGLRSVAAPILDERSRVIGSISVAGPTHRMTGDRFREELPETALGVANVIELNIQYS